MLKGETARGWLEIQGGVIVASGEGEPPRAPEIRGHWISPGLVDLQVNGGAGISFTDCVGAVEVLDEKMVRKGTTAYLATIISNFDESATRDVRKISQHRNAHDSAIIGIHLEGPFLNPECRGVHRLDVLRIPQMGVPAYFDDPLIKMVTLAPELPGAFQLIEQLARRGVVVSIGHSAAPSEVAENAVSHGASMVTHLFNAMSLFHHRDPGLVGWALGQSNVTLGLIADGMHVSPNTLSLVQRAASDRVLLVTDASSAALAPPGRYLQGGIAVERQIDGRVTAPNGGLAASSICLADAVKIWADATDTTCPDAIRAATYVPSSKIGLSVGLSAGNQADIVVWDEDLNVKSVVFRGDVVV